MSDNVTVSRRANKVPVLIEVILCAGPRRTGEEKKELRAQDPRLIDEERGAKDVFEDGAHHQADNRTISEFGNVAVALARCNVGSVYCKACKGE